MKNDHDISLYAKLLTHLKCAIVIE